MRKWLLGFFLLFAGLAHAQFFSTQKGTKLYYKSEDYNDGKRQVTTDTVLIKEVYTRGDTLMVKQENLGRESELLEGNEIFTFSLAKDGITHLSFMNARDGVGLIKENFMKGFQDMELTGDLKKTPDEREADFREYQKHVSCEGDVCLSLNPKAQKGDKLPETKFQYKLGPVTMRAAIDKGLVEGFESVTTPAGTFKCLKITYRMQYKIMFFSEKVYVTEWYGENIGLVKRVETDKKGKVLFNSTLIRK